MPDQRAERVAELVKSAVECGPERWAAFLDRECEGDPAMRSEIESFLREDEGASQFLEMPALHHAAESFVREDAFDAGQAIGHYEIVSLIGSGGMGDVYLALDRELHRKVALKLVRRGMASEEMIRHFKREENLLASLNHPNIAQLYGGGVSADGIPFFAMEYVEGQRLDEYCDKRGLGTKERLRLFRKVCSAVTYAHQHLVIHRDLKPANIRVTAEGEPKLLDFGIAKLLDTENARSSGQTLTLQGVMTPEYASPEQVVGGSITTASDVYTLGVVLYKLLTGRSPYRTKTNRPDEIVRAITDQDPERPSTVMASSQSDSSGNPQTGPGRTGDLRNLKSLRGDLDTIILMAMRKEPGRRYQSAAQFSADILRHLDGHPVLARKDTFTYRTSKYIKRHPFRVAAAFLILVSLIGGIVSTAWEAQRAERQRARAEKRFKDVRHLAHLFLFEIDPQLQNLQGATGARETLVKRALEYLDSLAQEAGDDRSLQYELAAAYFKVGNLQGKPYQPNLGDEAGALASFRKAQAIFEKLLAVEPTNAVVQHDLGYTYQYLGNILGEAGDQAGDLLNQQKAVAVFETLAAGEPTNIESRLNLVRGYNYLATATLDSAIASDSVQLHQKALQSHRQAIATIEAVSKTDLANRELRRQVASTYLRIGYTLRSMDDLTGDLSNYPVALEYDRKAQTIFDNLSASEPTNILYRRHTADARLSTGHSQLRLGHATAALETFRQAFSTFEALVEVDPLDVQARHDLADTCRNMAEALVMTHDWKNALEYARKALALYRTLDVTHPRRIAWIQTHEIIADLLTKIGDEEGAIASYRETLAVLERWVADEPTNKSARRNSALDYINIAKLYVIQAANLSAHEKKQEQSWAEARACYECSLNGWQYLQANGCLRAVDEGRYAEVLHEITKCDTAMAKP